MKNALSPKEWKEKKYDHSFGGGFSINANWGVQVEYNDCGQYSDSNQRVDIPREEGMHALAAFSLHNQPFGFTREDVELIRAVAYESLIEMLPLKSRAAVLDSLADRLSALLPPEEEG